MYVKMLDKEKRSIKQSDAMLWARSQLADVKDAKVSVEILPRFAGGGRKWADVQLEIRGPDLEVLDSIGKRVMEKMRAIPGYVDVDSSYDSNKPEVNLYVKRDASADLGVSPMNVASTIKALIGGEDVAKFRAEGDRYDISVRLTEFFRNTPDYIPGLTVRNRRGELVRIQSVANLRRETGPVQIDRYNRTRQITIMGNLDRGKKVLGEAVKELGDILKAENLPPGYTFGFAGSADTMKEAFANLIFAFLFSVVIVYMLLAAQFESFTHPLTIMMALPLSLIGAIGALILTKMTVTIYTMIGMIMLMGLVTKNGILLVDYINTLRERDGLPRREAILKAGPIRLRPILMTTSAVIFGMLPIAIGKGAGSESRVPMAIAVIGGLITSTLLTLLVIPAVYTVMDDLPHPRTWWIFRLFGGRKSE
ncbi:efflux RND transporter permease subunit [Candidatus Sumerlaeota bacterium]|nr:efflux RND transporter permease subunit [Candidatus Sumerlaeota bacterium]